MFDVSKVKKAHDEAENNYSSSESFFREYSQQVYDKMRKIFTPHELKTIEVDVEKKIFRVNGEDFGENCTGFSIDCGSMRDEDEFFRIEMRIESDIIYSSYSKNGEKTSDRTINRNGQTDCD